MLSFEEPAAAAEGTTVGVGDINGLVYCKAGRRGAYALTTQFGGIEEQAHQLVNQPRLVVWARGITVEVISAVVALHAMDREVRVGRVRKSEKGRSPELRVALRKPCVV